LFSGGLASDLPAKRCKLFAPTKTSSVNTHIRPAASTDIPVLRDLIEASVRGLQAKDYSPSQINSALATVFGVDTQLIADGTYFVAENLDATVPVVEGPPPNSSIVGCGGWSKRKTLYGGDQWSGREAALLDPQHDAAKIRAFFVHPEFARRGIGSMILEACENAAQAAGFTRFEMGATLAGVPLYKARGYVELEDLVVPLANGESLPIVRMEKRAP
jgi:GNAT superfamily N-acetyltransferase